MKVFLASPRGFCAGVERAVDIVQRCLDIFGPPIYVRHEIVHNRHVVDGFRAKGVIFVDELDEIPPGSLTIFSAHGISPAVREQAERRQLKVIDATCPLVTKVHLEVHRFVKEGYHILLIGHKGHAEVAGTMGEAPEHIQLVTSVDDLKTLQVPNEDKLIYLTQTTLSLDETREIVSALKARFPQISGPPRDDICYATQNRQEAVKALATICDVVLVVGSKNSSNSLRLCEVAEANGARGYLIDGPQDISPYMLENASAVGVTAGASAPESLVQDVLSFLSQNGATEQEELVLKQEDVSFALPHELASL